MRKKILITTTILISIVSSVDAQQSSKVVDVPAPPQTTALFKAVAAPVSYYTGQPDVTIPIYTILQDGVTIPISISFNTSGIFVNEEATAIGLGIRLNWGGSIIRSANGRPDERGLFLEQYKINELTEDLPKWGLFQKWPHLFLQSGHIFRSKVFTPFRLKVCSRLILRRFKTLTRSSGPIIHYAY